MPFGAVEILATIIIAISVIKVVLLSVHPKSWLAFASKIYANPTITSGVALVLAALVLYFLRGAGITIVEIFAVLLFISLLMLMSMARYAKTLIEYHKKKGASLNIWKEHWLDLLVWIVLLLWGIKELLLA